MGQILRTKGKKLDYFINFKGLIAIFESLRNKLKNGINFKDQKWCLSKTKYYFV